MIDEGYYLLTDINNCGACGNVCINPPHATSTACRNGECVITDCERGYTNCDGIFENGCENHQGYYPTTATYIGEVEVNTNHDIFQSCHRVHDVGPTYSSNKSELLQIKARSKITFCTTDIYLLFKFNVPSNTTYTIRVISHSGVIYDTQVVDNSLDGIVYLSSEMIIGLSEYLNIQISWLSGQSCDEWTLETYGGYIFDL
jgi:hypothetical protein